jgi:diguanylate cyclase (GGDEF)-like protein
MIVSPACCTDQATRIIEQLHVQVRQARPLSAQADCRYSFSAGIAQARAGENLESVFRRADHALYLAKQAGRNRSACAPH